MVKKVFSEEEIKKIIELYSDGYSCIRIGLIYGVSTTPIITLLKKHEILKKGKSNGKKINRFTKKIDTLQFEKIKWVNLNYKPVEILIIDKRNNKIINKPITN